MNDAHHHLDVLMRSWLESYLMKKTSMTAVEAEALTDEQIAEHFLGVNHIACVSPEIAEEIERIEARLAIGADVPLCELESALFAIYASPYGDYHVARVTA